ncbi:YbhB/YbcL family Raf kinase inhibitor-like protein [Streptomyces sp. SBT349]|uniref:YbhB/YbcL family Raf kinase inhibitor-like protein n=1 Tax=Streptomyces sp. SBT349 TaxID=1580539 RepID=UPI00066CEBCC|nr:YbhB/YbcL family Raf kinase inhibitor-like protein [Streptomyces sp. SBT349]
MTEIELSSSAFRDREPIPERYTQDGDNVSPPLSWSPAPAGTKELVLMCEDPDAPSGTYLHWLVTGIDPVRDGVATGRTPFGGTAHLNAFGDEGYDGPGPPIGDPAHRYVFRLFALPEPVAFPDRVSADEAHRALDRRRLAAGTLTGLHQR